MFKSFLKSCVLKASKTCAEENIWSKRGHENFTVRSCMICTLHRTVNDKFSWMRWAGHVAHMGDVRTALEKKPTCETQQRQEGKIKMNLTYIWV